MPRSTPRRRPRTPAASIAVLLAAVLGLAACSTSSPASVGSGNDRTLTIAIPATLPSLDPGLASNSRNSLTLAHDLYATLTQFDSKERLVGDLATSWKLTKPNAWTFTLRSGAKFQDGEALDASTIAWNYQRAKQDAKLVGGAKIVSAVSAVTVDSPTQITFVTGKQTFLNFPRLVAGWAFLPEKWTAAHDPDTQVDASGPYRLVSFSANRSVTLTANPTYFGAQPPISKVVYKVFADQSALTAGLLGGIVDVATELDPNELDQIKATGRFDVGGIPGLRVDYLAINTHRKPWDNPLVRQAASLAINRALITKTILEGYTSPSHRQLFAAGYTGYQDDLTPWPYDPATARKLLQQAGAVGTRAEFWVPQVIFAGAPQAAQAIADDLNAVGFKVSLKILPIAQWITTNDQTAALNYIGEASTSNSSDYILQAFKSSVSNPTTEQRGPQDRVIDRYIDQAWTASTTADQATAVRGFTDRVDATYRYLDLWPQVQTYAVSTKVKFTPRADDLDPAYDISWAH